MKPPQTVLFECQNVTLTAGTGIATYAHNLAIEARALGYSTAGLFGVDTPLVGNDPILDEIALFDACKSQGHSLKRFISRSIRDFVADPKGVEISELKPQGMVVYPGGEMLYREFDRVFAATDLMRRARMHFQRYGQLMPVKHVADVSLFHTTHAVPLAMPGVPTISTLHDIIPLRLPYTTLDDKGYFYSLVAQLVRKTDHIVTVSEHSRRDIIAFFKISEDRITNTYQSVSIDPAIANMTESELAEDLEAMHGVGLRDFYLFVGAIEPKKNVGRLIDAYVASGSRRPLILAGGLGWEFKADLSKINNKRFIYQKAEGGRITTHKLVDHVDYVSRKHLLKLIRGARALIFPSIYEGFGLPVLEAMSLGTPTIASNLSALPELTGDATLSVNPYEIDDMARAIRRVDRDDALCEELVKLGLKRAEMFSAENYQQRLSSLYKRLIA